MSSATNDELPSKPIQIAADLARMDSESKFDLSLGEPPSVSTFSGSVRTPIHDPAADAKLRARIRKLLSCEADVNHPDFIEALEHYRLDVLYPNRTVVYSDEYEMIDGLPRLVHRHVYHLCDGWEQAQQFIESSASEQQSMLQYTHIDPCDLGVESASAVPA